MHDRTHKTAVLANLAKYGSETTCKDLDGAPHHKHSALRNLYAELVGRVFDWAATHHSTPQVLDLGAGDGSATLPLLELGARVTAVDISENQLKALRAKCAGYPMLETRCQDVFDALRFFQAESRHYDVIVANSFLHHVPDYLGLIRQAIALASSHGQFFSFQDPLRYDSLRRFTRTYGKLAYYSWRVFQGDVAGGVRRTIRRSRGVYLEGCPNDYDEYHVIRDGVDQDAIQELLSQEGFECEIIRYFSTQRSVWQTGGVALGMENTFGVLATRKRERMSGDRK